MWFKSAVSIFFVFASSGAFAKEYTAVEIARQSNGISATYVFADGASPIVVGQSKPGTKIRFVYDVRRLLKEGSCIRYTTPGPAVGARYADIQMGYRFGDSNEEKFVIVAGASETSEHIVQVNDTIEVPEGVTSVEVWFSCQGYGERKYDSNGGQNFHLDFFR